jgi:hypothetical protein
MALNFESHHGKAGDLVIKERRLKHLALRAITALMMGLNDGSQLFESHH